MPDRSPSDRPDDDWPRRPDPWEEADRAYAAKWSGAPDDTPEGAPFKDAPSGDALPPVPSSYTPTRATPRAVTESYRSGLEAAGPYLGLGMQIAVSMVLFAGGGYLVDRWLGTTPWGILIGAALGMAGILALVVRVAREADQKGRGPRTR